MKAEILKATLRTAATFFALACTAALAQTSCPHFLLESPMVVNIEGFFINEKLSRVSLDVEWRHHPEALDTFFVNQPDHQPFNFITAGEYRYMEFPNAKVKRQLGTHHLKEHIGETPLKLDDMELLANGQFLCRDSTIQKPNILSTAFSMAWWSLVADSLPHPTRVTMNGPRKERRVFTIRQWRNYSGEMLPTLVKVENERYNGELWIRSAYTVQALQADPLKNSVEGKQKPPLPDLFRKIPVKGERKIPLILKLNQELLRE
ncbi:hypothetical protein SAMN05720470_101179 [Fibrobacter sp. UWOV1]|jgi:hypothetical protein|uniref:hypothetical protein n=1 Tax=Fibrobacter sp. UWOV1 TaxID=1896215 RepID=UPI00091815B6|nr:hypothetical protein [Fibrobacter sp. UWOV1]SHK34784.1 hypothetical protein SAMN05720470_101179 [Fibrobacter sp. UWOV1]